MNGWSIAAEAQESAPQGEAARQLDMVSLQNALAKIATQNDVEEIEALFFETAQSFLENITGALFIFIVFWIVSWAIGRIVLKLGGRLRADQRPIIVLLAQSVRLSLRVLGTIMALGTLGIDVTALVAGIGLAGFGLSLALKDVISNAVSGVMVLLNRPFKVGDRIQVGGDSGIVTDIDLRYTTLMGEARRILVPNSSLFSTTIRVEEQQPAEIVGSKG